MNQEAQDQGAAHIENFSGTVVTLVICYYEGSTRDQQDEFVLDKYTLQTRFQRSLSFHLAPVAELLGACSLETFLRALPARYFAFKTYRMCYGHATIGGEQVLFTSSPFAEANVLTFINGTLYTGSQVRGIFLEKRRSKLREEILEAALHHDSFIQTRTGDWRLYDREIHENMVLPTEETG